MNDPAPPAVDLEVLREATVGDRDLMQELAELYLSDTDLQLRALDDALSNREHDRIHRIAHGLEDASLAVGASPAAAIFAEIDAAVRAGDLDLATAARDRARQEFERVRRSLGDLR